MKWNELKSGIYKTFSASYDKILYYNTVTDKFMTLKSEFYDQEGLVVYDLINGNGKSTLSSSYSNFVDYTWELVQDFNEKKIEDIVPITDLYDYVKKKDFIVPKVWAINKNDIVELDLMSCSYIIVNQFNQFFLSEEDAKQYLDYHIKYCSCEYGKKTYYYEEKTEPHMGFDCGYETIKIVPRYCPWCGKEIKR